MTLFPMKRQRGSREVSDLRSEMDSLFDRFLSNWGEGFGDWGLSAQASMPIDMKETDKELIVRAELPGMKKEDFDVNVSDSRLTISGEKKEEKEEKEKGYIYRESSYGSFFREVPLPQGIRGEKASAKYEDGVLTVTLPKSEESIQKQKKLKIT